MSDALLLPGVRRLVHAAFGATLTAGALAVTTGASAAQAPTSPPALMQPAPPTNGALMQRDDTSLTPPATMQRDDALSVDRADHDAPAEAAGAGDEWTVRPGDHLWSVAESVLVDAWGRPVTDEDVDPYWRMVIAANRDRLADPENADLVFPGQKLRVPPPPPAPADSP